jgi:hypothetical protein
MYGVNGEEKGVLVQDMDTRNPMWMILDVYGNSTAVEIIDVRDYLNNSRRNLDHASMGEEMDRWITPAVSTMTIASEQQQPVVVPVNSGPVVEQARPSPVIEVVARQQQQQQRVVVRGSDVRERAENNGNHYSPGRVVPGTSSQSSNSSQVSSARPLVSSPNIAFHG